MKILSQLVEKLLREPSPIQMLVVADCLQENGFSAQADATRMGFFPDLSATWLFAYGMVHGCGRGDRGDRLGDGSGTGNSWSDYSSYGAGDNGFSCGYGHSLQLMDKK